MQQGKKENVKIINKKIPNTMKKPYPTLVLKSGLSLSVQASSYHYCEPRSDSGPYSSFEIGFPSEKIDKIMEYAEDPESPTATVYGYVPSQVVLEIIQDNQGIDYEAMGVVRPIDTLIGLESQFEALADIQHEIWAHWTKYQFSVCTRNEDGSITIPADKVERWERQAQTPYSELTEKEKESDREQVRKFSHLI